MSGEHSKPSRRLSSKNALSSTASAASAAAADHHHHHRDQLASAPPPPGSTTTTTDDELKSEVFSGGESTMKLNPGIKLTPGVVAELAKFFASNEYPNMEDREEMATRLKILPLQVSAGRKQDRTGSIDFNAGEIDLRSR